jgi:hypothetical protein
MVEAAAWEDLIRDGKMGHGTIQASSAGISMEKGEGL